MEDLTIKRENNKYIAIFTANIDNITEEMRAHLVPFLSFNRKNCGEYESGKTAVRCMYRTVKIGPQNTYTLNNTIATVDGWNIKVAISMDIDLLYDRMALHLTPKIENIAKWCRICDICSCRCKCCLVFMEAILSRESNIMMILRAVIVNDVADKIIYIITKLRNNLWSIVRNVINSWPEYKKYILANKTDIKIADNQSDFIYISSYSDSTRCIDIPIISMF